MDERTVRDLAWVGDAVLALFVREWLLHAPQHPRLSRQERFILFTSNRFLQRFGEPTRVEAVIGQIYQDNGLQAAFDHISTQLLPAYEKHLQSYLLASAGQKR